MRTYKEFVYNTYNFPNEEFHVKDNWLWFNDLNLKEVIQEHATPTRLSYLPKVDTQISQAKELFKKSMQKHGLNTKYIYTYCTKSSHFDFMIQKCLESGAQIETSSAFDIQIVRNLHSRGLFDKNLYVLANGFKRPTYLKYLCEMIEDDFENCVPILDNISEFQAYKDRLQQPYKVGIRLASDESPNFNFYTSRLGINQADVIPFYKEQIANDEFATLHVLHFFINTGIKDTPYYWTELGKFLNLYCELKKLCPELSMIDIGGGFPIKTELNFEYDYAQMIDWVVEQVKSTCEEHGVEPPNIVTEFGSYTVGETGAMIYSILDQKRQNDKELWYMIDGSFITNLPDTWALNQQYILLALNHWDSPYTKVNLGGLTCDSMDYYNTQRHKAEVYLPKPQNDEPLYVGLFHTGAYQEALSGYGGIQHCLIPQPKHVIYDTNPLGELNGRVFMEEQQEKEMLGKLGYTNI